MLCGQHPGVTLGSSWGRVCSIHLQNQAPGMSAGLQAVCPTCVLGGVASLALQPVSVSRPAVTPLWLAAAAAKSLQLCPTLCDHIHGSPPGSPVPGSQSPGKNTGVGCHFFLQCMKVKSESEVAQSCPTLSDPMDCSLPGSSVHGIFQARVLEWGAIAFSGFLEESIIL